MMQDIGQQGGVGREAAVCPNPECSGSYPPEAKAVMAGRSGFGDWQGYVECGECEMRGPLTCVYRASIASQTDSCKQAAHRSAIELWNDLPRPAAQPLPSVVDDEALGHALFVLSDKLRASGFLKDEANHAAYEKVVAAFQGLSATPSPPVGEEPKACPDCNGRAFAKVHGSAAYRCVGCKRVIELPVLAQPKEAPASLDQVAPELDQVADPSGTIRSEMQLRDTVEAMELRMGEMRAEMLAIVHEAARLPDTPGYSPAYGFGWVSACEYIASKLTAKED